MPVRSLAQSTPETIQGFEAASEEKYEDGFNLMATASPGNGIYLMGYAAEMLLKAAYFRVIGLAATVPITRQHLRNARAEAAILGVVPDDEQFHNVAFWGEIVIKKRTQQARALSPVLADGLEQSTKRLSQNWYVEMRYRSIQGVSKQDVEDVLDDVIWIKSNHENFWR